MTVGSFFRSSKAGLTAGATVAALVLSGLYGQAQVSNTPAATDTQQKQPAVTGNTTTTTDAQGKTEQTSTLSISTSKKKKKVKVAKEDQVKQSKDTKAELKKEKKYNPLIGKDAALPDKALYDKAMDQAKHGHYDVSRLELQALLNTYPDSQYQMRAKLGVADTFYREGGSASLAQAEQEYSDFITFFPSAAEAAEAQMRIGDIYLKQMDVPDRDYTKAVKAQEAYRTMLKQYPDAPKKVVDEAKQKLRDVQEVMATREADLGTFYASRENWPASIARYQTVVDLYPQYSHMDDVLIGIGDAYEAEARAVRAMGTKMPEGPKAKLEEDYDGRAASAYRKVVLEHAAAQHVEDAKERLAGMNLPIPTPTLEQTQASEMLEGSRAQYDLRRRLELLVLHRPDTVAAAQVGEPPLEDKPITTAPTIVNQIQADYVTAFNPNAKPAETPAAPATDINSSSTPTAAATPATASTPLTLSDVTTGGATADSNVGTMTAAPENSGGTAGASVGVEVLTPGINRGSGAASDLPAATGAPDPNYGLNPTVKTVTALPPVEKPAVAPDPVNEAAGKQSPAAAVKDPNQKKNPKPSFDKNDESSSKHKKKKGLSKINPFDKQ